MDFMAYEQAIPYLQQAALEYPNIKNIKTKEAFAHFRLGNFEDAIRAVKEEISHFPNNLNAFILLGYIYFQQGKYEDAALACQDFNMNLEKALEEELKNEMRKTKYPTEKDQKRIYAKIHENNPNFGLPDFILGFYHKRNRSFREAYAQFRLSLERGYNPVHCFIQMIDIMLIQGDWQGGIELSRKAVKKEGEQSEFYFLMGYCHYQLEERRQALACFNKTLQLKPFEVEAIRNLAVIYFNQTELDKAIPLLKKIQILAPQEFETQSLLERALSRNLMLDKEEFQPKLSKDFVGRITPEYKYVFEADFNYVANTMNVYALNLVNQGEIDRAINLLQRFLELNDLSPGLNYNLAQLYNTQNILGKALKYAWRAIELKKNYRDSFDLVGQLFFKMRDFEDSVQFYQEALKIDPKDALGYYNLGCAYYEMSDFAKAEENWKLAIQNDREIRKKEEKAQSKDELNVLVHVRTDPVSFDAHFSLGKLYLQQNLKEKALEEFLSAVELNPQFPDPYYEIGKILYELKDPKKAKVYFDQYLYLGGKNEKVKEFLKSIIEKML